MAENHPQNFCFYLRQFEEHWLKPYSVKFFKEITELFKNSLFVNIFVTFFFFFED